MAKQTTELAASLPKHRAEIEKRVTAEMGDLKKKLDDLKARKGKVHLDLMAAEERERPAKEAAIAADVERARQADLAKLANANDKRKREDDANLRRRLSEAAR